MTGAELAQRRNLFAAAVRSRRETAGLTQRQLAERVGRVRQWVCYVETAQRSPTLDDLWLLAEALGCSAADLVAFPAAATAALAAAGGER